MPKDKKPECFGIGRLLSIGIITVCEICPWNVDCKKLRKSKDLVKATYPKRR
jgi:hypothetical protein